MTKELNFKPDGHLSPKQNIEKALKLFLESFGFSPSVCYVPSGIYNTLHDEELLVGTTKVRLSTEEFIIVKG